MSNAVSIQPEHRAELESMSSQLGHGTGLWFILVGIIFIVAATVRFVRTRAHILDQEIHTAGFMMEFVLAVVLAALIVVASIPLLVSAL